MPTYKINVNGADHTLDVEENMPLLWALRDIIGLVGTKFGCGIAQCGACTVHLNDVPVRSCSMRVADVVGQSIRTIEGLADGENLHPLQQAWIEQDVAQCGYCQAGQIMSAAALLKQNPKPSDADIDAAMYVIIAVVAHTIESVRRFIVHQTRWRRYMSMLRRRRRYESANFQS